MPAQFNGMRWRTTHRSLGHRVGGHQCLDVGQYPGGAVAEFSTDAGPDGRLWPSLSALGQKGALSW